MTHRRQDFSVHQGETFSEIITLREPLTGGVNCGRWSRFGQYELANIVRYLGTTYHCIQRHINEELPDAAGSLFWLALAPQDLTAWGVITSTIRRSSDSGASVSFTILNGGVNGELSITLDDLITTTLSGVYEYNILATILGEPTTVLHGSFTVHV